MSSVRLVFSLPEGNELIAKLAIKHDTVTVIDAYGVGVMCLRADEAWTEHPEWRDVLRKARQQLEKENGT